ncbi:MAG: hypothetical protein NC489_26820 [Ruminococcus flavefaciens]|nr:hypothetical protein [Ruminococcus flavefaciens]
MWFFTELFGNTSGKRLLHDFFLKYLRIVMKEAAEFLHQDGWQFFI